MIFLALWHAGWLAINGHAQEVFAAENHPGNGRFVCRAWRAEEGLPQESVWAITQTRDGYLWIGTGGGLARFDGVKFEVFGIQDGLPSMQIRALLEDRSGALWIGTASGLCRYEAGKFTNWPQPAGPASEGVLHLAEDGAGGIWIASNLGLSRWGGGRLEKIGPEQWVKDPDVRSMTADRQGRLWISTVGQGLLRFDGHRFAPPFPGTEVEALRPYRLMCDHEGRVWAAAVGSIYCLGATNWSVYGPASGLPEVLITCLAESRDGTILAGTSDQGLLYLEGERFQQIGRANGLSDDAVRSIAQDAEGNIWVGTRGAGLNRLQPRHLSTLAVYDGATEAQPVSLAETEDGSLWVGTIGHGLYRFKGDHYEVLLRQEMLPRNLQVSALAASGDGSLWGVGGASLFNWRNAAIHLDAPARGVHCLCEDREGTLWLGDERGELQRRVLGKLATVPNPLRGSAITAMVPAPDGGLWVASYNHGLGRLQQDQWQVYDRKQGLRSELLRALCLDEQNTLWIGTEGGGLSRLQAGRIASFGRAEGVPEDTILQILADDRGMLWLGTQHGIVRVARGDLARVANHEVARVYPRIYGRSDGMLTEQCSGDPGTCLKTRAGRLCFATGRGVVIIDPHDPDHLVAPPAVRLERVVVDGRPFSLTNFPARPGGGRELTLQIPPGNQRVEFYFTGLFFSAPERVGFRYRLEGFDAEWSEVGPQRSAVYTHLPPDNYRFVVAAQNGNGVWSPAEVAVNLAVQPFFWQRRMFLAVVAGLLALIIAWSVRIVEKRKARIRLRHLELAHAMEAERARIARDIHDDIGAGLTEIGLTSELVEDPGLSAADVRQFAHEISVRSRELVAGMDEIVWAINPRNDTLRSSLAYFSQFADRMFKPTGISCRIEVPPNLAEFPLGSEQRHNFFLGFKEALNNILKHAQASEVRIRAQLEAGEFVLMVADNGVGFAAVPAGEAQDGLVNLKDRMAKIGGRCEIRSEPGRGTTLTFRLPLSRNGVKLQ